MLTADDIAQLIPHGRGMSLLEKVVAWNDNSISCSAINFLSVNNPLCEAGKLDNIILIEYAAQAVAVHLSLSNGSFDTPRSAYIGAVKDVVLAQKTQPQIEIEISALCLLKNDNGCVYEFAAMQNTTTITSGKLYLNYLSQSSN